MEMESNVSNEEHHDISRFLEVDACANLDDMKIEDIYNFADNMSYISPLLCVDNECEYV